MYLFGSNRRPSSTTSGPSCMTPAACRSMPATASSCGVRWAIGAPVVEHLSAWRTRLRPARRPRVLRYEDLDDRYDLRPSAWIEPKGDWGKGTVELVEIRPRTKPTTISSRSGTPETQPEVGKPLDFAYRLHWTMDEDGCDPKSSWVKQTMRSVGDVKQKNLIRQQDGSTGRSTSKGRP
ncbi:glucan biosynthesis protein [Pseudomonas aeruginosa]